LGRAFIFWDLIGRKGFYVFVAENLGYEAIWDDGRIILRK